MAEPSPAPDQTVADDMRVLGARAAGGEEQLDAVIGWAAENLSASDKAAYNRLLQNPSTAEAAVQQLAGFASASAGTTPGTGTGPAPSPATARRETRQAGAIVSAAPAGYHASHLDPVQQPGPAPAPGGNVTTPQPGTDTGFRTAREMLTAMDAADRTLGDWRQDEALIARLNATPKHVRQSTG